MKIVPPIDAAWVLIESAESPMHFGSLQIYSLPAGAGQDYVSRVVAELRKPEPLAPPYSQKLKDWALSGLVPAWIEAEKVDLEYHIQHIALPAPGGDAELSALIAELQSRPLDMTLPLWECHVIEGLAHRRFALFMKIHHSLMDGVSGMHLLQQGLSTDRKSRHMPAPWSLHRKHAAPPANPVEHPHGGIKHALDFVFGQVKSAPDLYHAFGAFLHSARVKAGSDLSVPYLAPKTPFNGRTSTQRRFASLQLPLARLHAVASHAGVTVNDVFLAVCGGALRRYLADLNALPEQALIAGIPVSVRAKGDTSACTAVTFMLASMGTEEADALRRLREVHRSTSAAKEHLHGLRREALTDYTLLLMTPYAIELLTGLGGHGHPVFNVVVSNVPGPAEPLYFNGARLEAIFPMSILTHGQSLNITVLSYAGQLHVGFTACAKAIPHVQHLADYTGDAFEELVALVLHPKARRQSGAPRKRRVAAPHSGARKRRPELSSV